MTSRIESQNKELETRLLVSDEFLSNFQEGILKKGLSTTVKVKGKHEPLSLHEILGFLEPDTNLEVQSTLDVILKDEVEFA